MAHTAPFLQLGWQVFVHLILLNIIYFPLLRNISAALALVD